MSKFYLTLGWLILALLSTLVISSCGSSNPENGITNEKDSEKIRFINAIKSETAVNIQLGDHIFIEELAYGDATGFFEAPEGDKIEFRVNSVEKVVPLLSAEQEIKSSAKQTFVLLNVENKASLIVIDESATKPLTGEVKLRMINLSEERESVDVYLTYPEESLRKLNPATEGLAFKAASDYLSFPAGTYDIVYTLAGSSTIVRRAESVTFEAGTVYTHYLIDRYGFTTGQTSRIIKDTLF